MGDTAADFEQMDAAPSPSAAADRERDEKGKFKAGAKPPEKAAEVEPPPEGQVEKPPEVPDKEKTPEAPPEVVPKKASELRPAYEALKKRVKEELEPEVQRLRAKVQDFETRKPDENTPVLQENKVLKERNEHLEKVVAFREYTESKEFTEKYAEPYRQAWNDAVSEFRELRVREPDGTDENTGDPKFRTRPATEDDIVRLANMSLSEMDEAVTEMFGHSAARAIGHIQNIKKLSNAQAKAIADAKTKSTQWYKERETATETETKALAAAWAEENKSLEARFPKAYQPVPTDDDDRAAHTKGFALANALFFPAALTPEEIEALPEFLRDTFKSKQPLSLKQRVRLHSIARLKMANHDRRVADLKKARARIAELEKSLGEYEKSSPPGGRAGAGGSRAPSKSLDEQVADEIRALDK